MDENDRKPTEYNSNQLTVLRIDEIKKGLAIALTKRDYEVRFDLLKVYFFELTGILEKEDDKKALERYREMYSLYKQVERARREGKKILGFNFNDKLDEWEIELRNLEQGAGLGLTKKDYGDISDM